MRQFVWKLDLTQSCMFLVLTFEEVSTIVGVVKVSICWFDQTFECSFRAESN